MLVKNKAYKLLFISVFSTLLISTFFIKKEKPIIQPAQADTCYIDLTVILRDGNGDFIPNMSYQIYSQETDVDDNKKPVNLIASGIIDPTLGKSTISFLDLYDSYVLKTWDPKNINGKEGVFWFYDNNLVCGSRTIEKKISSMEFILRDTENNLKANQSFSIYSQKPDANNNLIKGDIIANLMTPTTGKYNIFLPSAYRTLNGDGGSYLFEAKTLNGGIFQIPNIRIVDGEKLTKNYVFSDLFINLKNAANKNLNNTYIAMHKQNKNSEGNYTLGTLVGSFLTNDKGEVTVEYNPGTYALVIKDDLNKDNIFWDVNIEESKRNYKTLTKNIINVKAFESNGKAKGLYTPINIYALQKNTNGSYYQDILIYTVYLDANGKVSVSLAPGAYLFTTTEDYIDNYGKAMYVENGKEYNIDINLNKTDLLSSEQEFWLTKAKPTTTEQPKVQSSKLRGYILLQVEANGEAWYVNPADELRYYMKNGAVAYEMMRKFGLGITNADLNKIPLGLDDRFNELDSDKDGLPDKMEEALGTDINDPDTDNDSYLDGDEIKNGYNPNGPGKLTFDNNTAEKLKGKILLQVESRGEAWYVNPKDGKKYYMKDGDSAYEIMRFLSLGITNADLSAITAGEIQ